MMQTLSNMSRIEIEEIEVKFSYKLLFRSQFRIDNSVNEINTSFMKYLLFGYAYKHYFIRYEWI